MRKPENQLDKKLMENQTGKKIFLSYSSKSKEETKKLASALEKMKHEVWFDKKLCGGQDWWDEICRNIVECELFIFVLDKNSQQSEACDIQWRYAVKLGSAILPVKIANDVSEKILPTQLAKCQIFDYSERGVASFLDLEKQIRDIPLPVKLPTLPPQPPAPDTDETAKQKNNKITSQRTIELTSHSKAETFGSGCAGAVFGSLFGLLGGAYLVGAIISVGPSTNWLILVMICIAMVIGGALGAWLAIFIQRL